jgi:hypothetical protein
MDLEVLRDLREKYALMLEMRREDALRFARPSGEVDPRARMRTLAARFPGALREIDELPLDRIESRIAALDVALRGGDVPRWARTLGAYHGWMRAALAIKRRFGRTRAVDDASRWLQAHHRAGPGDPPVEVFDRQTLAAILRPPRGRLSGWILHRVAEDLGQDPGELEREAFEPSPRRGGQARSE